MKEAQQKQRRYMKFGRKNCGGSKLSNNRGQRRLRLIQLMPEQLAQNLKMRIHIEIIQEKISSADHDYCFFHSYIFRSLQKILMKPGYSGPPQNTNSPYSPGFKHTSPNPSKLSHNTVYTNSTKDLSNKKEELKDSNFLKSHSPPYHHANQTKGHSPKKQDGGTKVPSFLESKSPHLKGSLYIGEGMVNGHRKFHKNDNEVYNSTIPERPRKPPKMSEANYPEMQGSNIQGPGETKIPSFLLEKQEKAGKIHEPVFSKKVPYSNDALERPESSKQVLHKLKHEFPTDTSLSSSYGLMKQSKIESVDPTQEWVKKSWSKKKEKKITINDFEQIKELGSGKYGQVYLAKEKKTNFICALKIVEKQLLREEEITEQFIRELKIQTYLNHPNIIKMFGFFDDPVNMYIILEVGTGGQLFKQLKKHQSMPEHRVAGIMRHVCQAINELHSHRIIHRDIKPQNIVLHDNVIKLCDFGWSVYRDESMRKTFCGTPLYVCPQILKGKEYDEKIDIWSLGVMMYEMIVGENPFKITKEEQLIKIVKDNISIPSYIEICDETRNFLESCLQKNSEHRSSIRELLNHEFFKKFPEKNDKKMGI